MDKNTGKRRNEVQVRNFADGGRYEGELSNDTRKGYGIYFFASGYTVRNI